MPKLLDLFCGIGGWSKAFKLRGWHTTGVDIAVLGYSGDVFIKQDVMTLTPEFIDSFDAICASPPCEEFARAWLPWLRGDHKPEQLAISLLHWSVGLCDRKNRIVECSRFAAKHCPGADMRESWALWGDVPLLMSIIPRNKMKKSGLRPDLRAEIPRILAESVADHFTRQL